MYDVAHGKLVLAHGKLAWLEQGDDHEVWSPWAGAKLGQAFLDMQVSHAVIFFLMGVGVGFKSRKMRWFCYRMMFRLKDKKKLSR